MIRRPPRSTRTDTLFPYTTLCRSDGGRLHLQSLPAQPEGFVCIPPRLANFVPASPNASVGRSEEHTSELQSLMRISYAVFCLKKKNKKKRHVNNNSKNSYIHQHTPHKQNTKIYAQ